MDINLQSIHILYLLMLYNFLLCGESKCCLQNIWGNTLIETQHIGLYSQSQHQFCWFVYWINIPQAWFPHKYSQQRATDWQLLPSGCTAYYLKATSPLMALRWKSIKLAVILQLDHGKVETLGMNIADLSLLSVKKKAQGINKVLISIVNQQRRAKNSMTHIVGSKQA